MPSVVLVLCLALSLACLAASNRGMTKKLERIEERVEHMEARQDLANIARREDKEELFLRLDDIEALMNNTVTGQIRVEPEQSEDDESQIASEMMVVQKAFAEEKNRWRREASKIGGTIMDVQHKVEASIDKLDSSVNKNIKSLKDAINGNKDEILDEMKTCSENNRLVLDKLSAMEKLMEERVTNSQQPGKVFSSCLSLYREGVRTSGVYAIYPAPGQPAITVYCDMDTDGGGWTVFQHRQDGSVDFFRNWEDYAKGFGKSDGEFWLGNEHISALTNTCCHELRVDLEDFDGNRVFAKYSKFQVAPRDDNFRLDVSGYSGNASDSLIIVHSGREFSTKDHDNDRKASGNCATDNHSGWWFSKCYQTNLNGRYIQGTGKGIIWYKWKDLFNDSLKTTEMKVRLT